MCCTVLYCYTLAAVAARLLLLCCKDIGDDKAEHTQAHIVFIEYIRQVYNIH
jgi:hypothetical protein